MQGAKETGEAVNSEWECFVRAQRGDENAWHQLLRQYQSRLTALALLITGSVTAADDIVQETFVKAFRARVRNESGTVSGFLGTIAYRLAVKEAKRRRHQVVLDGHDLPDRGRSPLEEILDSERDRQVAESIASLDADHREVLILRFYGGHGYEEIAKLIHLPLGTVKSRIFYGVKYCREALMKKGVLG